MILELHRQVQNLFRDIIEERRQKGTYLDNPADFLDVFLLEIHNRKNLDVNNGTNYYTDEQLIMVCVDLFFTVRQLRY